MEQLLKAALPLQVEDPCEENQLRGCAQSPPEQFCAMCCLLVFLVWDVNNEKIVPHRHMHNFLSTFTIGCTLITKYQTLLITNPKLLRK